ncbi:MAG: PIN domain-containing protein [Planctomycetia bacterium]|nr:PIN domain-containing protein [Planctomycetia bacterium]
MSYIMNNHTLAQTYQPHLAGYDLAISFQTLAELLEGGALAGWGPVRWANLQSMLLRLTVLDSSYDVAARWAEIRAIRQSQPIPVADCWITATALAYGLELVSHNPTDFQGIPGLVVITEDP